MKQKIKLGLIIALACLVLLSLSACGQKTEIERQLVEVSRGDLVLKVSADGNLSLPRDRKLTFGISGTVAKVNVEEGNRVSEGQVLASLDTTSLELARNTARQAVLSAEIDLKVATDDFNKITYPYTYRTFALDIPTAIARVNDALQELNESMATMKELGLSREQYSWEQYWDVWNRLQRAQDDLTKAKEQLVRGYGPDVFQSGVLRISDFWTLRAAELAMEKAQVALDDTKNDLTKVENDLSKAVITAPFDGVIAVVDIKEGDNLSSVDYSTRTICQIVDLSIMELEAKVDEIDVPEVKLGQEAIISVDALPNLQLEGKVTYISPLSTEESGLTIYQTKISFDATGDSGLRAGMTATADIITNKRSNVLLVPNRAITQDGSGNPVVKVMVNEQIEERPVSIGLSDGFQTEILEGLSEGETVVIERTVQTTQSGGSLFGQ